MAVPTGVDWRLFRPVLAYCMLAMLVCELSSYPTGESRVIAVPVGL